MGELRDFFAELLGPDWEEKLLLADAIVDPLQGQDWEIDVAAGRAVELAKRDRPDLAWSDDLKGQVREAWFGLWVDNG